jgi:hypothetical protein
VDRNRKVWPRVKREMIVIKRFFQFKSPKFSLSKRRQKVEVMRLDRMGIRPDRSPPEEDRRVLSLRPFFLRRQRNS